MNAFAMLRAAGQPLSPAAVEVLSERREGAAVLREMLIEAEVIPGKRVSLYGWLGVPASAEEPCAAVLHIHGGKQTASPEQVAFWARRGYAAFSYDWYGDWAGRERFSDLSGLPAEPLGHWTKPERSVMLTRVLVARAVVGWLCARPEVDARRLGVYGVSWGGSITWLLNSYDKRLRAACAVYGVGEMTLPGREYGTGKLYGAAQRQRWAEVLDPACRAAQQNAPLLVLQASNDFWGWLDTTARSAAAVPAGRCSLSISAQYNHHLDADAAVTLEHWMDSHLNGDGAWPKAPAVRLGCRGGILKAMVKPDSRWPVAKVAVHASQGDFARLPAPSRYWQKLPTEPTRQGWQAALPVFDPRQALAMYADVVYENGVKVSALPGTCLPASYGAVAGEVPRNELGRFDTGVDGWFCATIRPDPLSEAFATRLGKGQNGMGSLTVAGADPSCFEVATRKPTDPRWRRWGREAGLSIWLNARAGARVTVVLTHAPRQAGQREWLHRAGAAGGWQQLVLGLGDFADEEGRASPCWSLVELLTFRVEGDGAEQTSALGSVAWV